MQIGRQGDAGGLKDAVDLAGDGGDALPSFSMGRLLEAVEGRAAGRPIRQIRPGELIKAV